MLNRTRVNTLYRWWHSIDKVVLSLVLFMLFLSNIFVVVASPIVARRIGSNPNIFIIKNIIFSVIGVGILVFFSLFSEKKIITISFYGFFLFLFLIILTILFSTQYKGSKRWLYIFGFSLQPTEIIKPFFIVMISYILTNLKSKDNLHIIISLILYIVLSFLLLLQPDIGMLILISGIFIVALFLIGIEIKYFLGLGLLSIFLGITLYIVFPHFNKRINTYVNSVFFGGEKSYQIQKSLSAFTYGGLLGKGPFEGSIKNYIPDAHTDFIFSVIGEEFGSIVCIFIIGLYFYIAIRLISKVIYLEDNFKYVAITCLSLQILSQAIINISVTLNLIPTKGMTLPLISYGGSSMIGTCITFGFLISLTEKQYESTHFDINSLIRMR